MELLLGLANSIVGSLEKLGFSLTLTLLSLLPKDVNFKSIS